MINAITRTTACDLLAEHAANHIRITTEVSKGNKDRAMRFLLNRMLSYLEDVQREDTEGMDPDLLDACSTLLEDFGPALAMQMGTSSQMKVIRLLRDS